MNGQDIGTIATAGNSVSVLGGRVKYFADLKSTRSLTFFIVKKKRVSFSENEK